MLQLATVVTIALSSLAMPPQVPPSPHAIHVELGQRQPVAYRVHQHSKAGNDYWIWFDIHPTRSDDACAEMFRSGDAWQVVALHTLHPVVVVFPVREDAERYAEFVCPSISPKWRTVR
jgi:hypothetical protein